MDSRTFCLKNSARPPMELLYNLNKDMSILSSG